MLLNTYNGLFKLGYGGLESNTIKTPDHTFFYEKGTNNETVDKTFIIAHGACATGRYMSLIAREILSEIPNTKVIVLDLPFHGNSTSRINPEGLKINAYAQYTYEFVDALQASGEIVGDVYWLGWSMGGSLGLLLNIHYGLFDGLVLLNSAPYWESVNNLLALEPFQNAETIKEAFKGIVLNDLTDEEDKLKELFIEHYDEITASGLVMKNDFESLTPEHYDLRGALIDVSAKTLICSGDADPVAVLEMQQYMDRIIPKSQLVLTEDNHTSVLKVYRVLEIVQDIKAYFF